MVSRYDIDAVWTTFWPSTAGQKNFRIRPLTANAARKDDWRWSNTGIPLS